jgi:hypothetical protein
MSSSAFAESGRIPDRAGTLSFSRIRFRTQLFATFRFFASRRSGLTPRTRRGIPEINWMSIAGMRNVLVHDYFEVDFETVWLVVARDLPPLETAMRAILVALDQLG